MKKMNVRMLTKLSIVAALYVAITLVLQPLSYGAIQFRVSEALMLLVIYNPLYGISLTLGCLIANIASSLGAVDIIFGTLATLLSCLIMFKIKNVFVSSLIPAIVNGIVIGLELYFLWEVPLWLGMIQVFVGEFVVCTLFGIPLFRAFEKNEAFMKQLEIEPLIKDNKISPFLDAHTSLMLALAVVSTIMFFNLGLFTVEDEQGNKLRYTLYVYATKGLNLANSYKVLFIVLVIPFISVPLIKFLHNYVALIALTIVSLIGIALLIYISVVSKATIEWYFYSYFLCFIMMFVLALFKFLKEQQQNNSI